MEHHAPAQLKFTVIAVDGDKALTDKSGVGQDAGTGYLLHYSLQLRVIAGVCDDGIGNGHIHGRVLQRHVGAAVEGCRHASIAAQHIYRQPCIGGGHIDLVVDPTAGECTEGVQIHLFTRSGQACAYTGGVGLGNARLIGAVGISRQQLLGVDTAHQVAVHITDVRILRHHILQRQCHGITAGSAVLFMLSDQLHFHFSTSCKALSAKAIASCHCSSLGWEECSCFGSANVAPLALTVFRTIQEGTPFLS